MHEKREKKLKSQELAVELISIEATDTQRNNEHFENWLVVNIVALVARPPLFSSCFPLQSHD